MLTTHMQVFALYGALNGLIILILALLVVRVRMRTKVMIGDGGNPGLVLAQRAHGNAVENVPLILVLLLAMAGLKTSMLTLHLVGGFLTFGRILHAIGLSRSAGTSAGRFLGTLLTWMALLIAVAVLFFTAFRA